ncbi:MAG: SIMPL domain-containing protein [Caulobacter sp.]|nr:SIMPL domain-containing protein [Caulobacter sp.]
MKTLFRAAALGALIVAGASGAAMAQTAPATAAEALFRATTLNLSASGETRQRPDMATITLGVQVEAPTASEAMRQNAVRMNQVIAALKRGGVADRDIQTSGLNLNPQYVYQENLPPRLTGYQASNQVTIRVRDLTKLGQAVDASVNAGANNVGGVAFGLQNSDAAEDAARLDAVKALQAKADLYARATGYRIARLVTLSEGGGYNPPSPMPMVSMARMDKAESTPTEAGELTVRIDISATYELVK